MSVTREDGEEAVAKTETSIRKTGEGQGLAVKRFFTTAGVHPYDEIEWDIRDAVIPNYKDGGFAFEQRGVEFPASWSQNATNIVAQKYFRGPLGTPEREQSVRQLVDRVADTITAWGWKDGYFADEAARETFNAELKHILVTQKAAFNSPVWFNVGSEKDAQCSACFILAVDDSMSSILNWYVEEGTIFKGGSGSGVNLSSIRSSRERLSSGGEASGPVSFMRGADASAGTIKSGGKTRRAAKMVILNVDHPDVEDFIWCKAREEQKARALRDAGFDMDLDGRDAYSIQYQNANNSVRVTDEFMMAYVEDRDWGLRAVKTGEIIEVRRARDLMRQMAQASWECADPGIQYDTTINAWHTSSNTGRINGSNPCFPGDSRVHTDRGLVRFDDLVRRVLDGEAFNVYTHDITNPEAPQDSVQLSRPTQFMVTGVNEIVRLRFADGREVRCTPNHRLWTETRGWVRADELGETDVVPALAHSTSSDAERLIRIDREALFAKGDHSRALEIPEKWDAELAHYVGWLVGDGCISGNVVSTVYGSDEDREEILPRHAALLAKLNGGVSPKPSVQKNGTVQLRLSRRALARFFEALGVKAEKAAGKTVPSSIFEAPADIQATFLQGLFDSDGCAVDSGNATRYVGLGSKSHDLLRGAQALLSTFGVAGRIYDVTGNAPRTFTYERVDGTVVEYQSDGPSFDLRISGADKAGFQASVGFGLQRKANILASMLEASRTYTTARGTTLVERVSDGFEQTYNLTEPLNHSYIVDGIVVSNCSEYMHLDNSACNLASLNLMKFVDDDMNFDIPGFKHTVDVIFLSQEILVGNSSYPTPKIEQNAKNFRELGIGYANIGALLMARGLPYDSDGGRAWAGAITALLTGWSYRASAMFAEQVGPHAGFAVNREPMLNVIAKHRAAVATIDSELVPEALMHAAQTAWDDALALGEKFGYRNSQASVLAPTGTIGLMMDCDTTGVEPDLALVKTKKLVGGGTMKIVNQTVPRALARLGYDDAQQSEILAHIADHNSVETAPHIIEEHKAVFDCAMGDSPIHYMGHVKMMAAVQPFISGAISKCVVGETLIATEDGLRRIGQLHQGEAPDSFRDHVMAVASLGGEQKTDAFYYGGVRPTREVVLRSGQRVVGTPNHRLLVATPDGMDWRRLDEIQAGEYVAIRYGSEMWSPIPARFDAFRSTPRYGNQKAVQIPAEMTEELAFLLGAYASEGHTTRVNWTVTITNQDEGVLARVQAAWRACFGVEARIARATDRCPGVVVASKEIVEFLDWLGCGTRASEKRIPDAVLRSPRAMVLSFLQGLALDAYTATMGESPKWAICLDAPAMLDDLQAVLTNLGIVHSRITKHNTEYDKDFDEVYASGEAAQALIRLVPFAEVAKAERASLLLAAEPAQSTADVVPGIVPRDLYDLIPVGKPDRGGDGNRTEFAFLIDPRTKHVSRRTLERVADVVGVVLPAWLRSVLEDGLHFSPVERVADAGAREVFDVSVPVTNAFVANGIVNHNTINMPETATVEDVEDLITEGWRLGLKALAIYRDNCKVAQPLSADKKVSAKAPDPAVLATGQPQRKRLPKSRPARTTSFRVGDQEGYMNAGSYPDDGLGEIFLKVAKQGSTLSGITDAFAIAISLGLQYGVPLEAYVSKFMNMKFEPSGMTDDEDIRFSTSLVDYIFRRLAIDHLSPAERERLGIATTAERRDAVASGAYGAPAVEPAEAPPAAVVPEDKLIKLASEMNAIRLDDAPFCFNCGDKMQPAGSCFACPSCGATSGCS